MLTFGRFYIEAMRAKQKICETCHGSGQVSYFKGVSRFLLSSEECPECAGLGFIPLTGQKGTDFKSVPDTSPKDK